MTASDLKDLLERIQTWPEEAQNELVAVANQIESDLQGDYVATRDELEILDAAWHPSTREKSLRTTRSRLPCKISQEEMRVIC